jgi:hypothetical protein
MLDIGFRFEFFGTSSHNGRQRVPQQESCQYEYGKKRKNQ